MRADWCDAGRRTAATRRRPAAGFFAAIAKPAPEGLDSSYAYLLGIPQPVIERLLEEHAIELMDFDLIAGMAPWFARSPSDHAAHTGSGPSPAEPTGA